LAASSFISARDIMAPRDASRVAVAKPIPDAAPVMATCSIHLLSGMPGQFKELVLTTLPSKDPIAELSLSLARRLLLVPFKVITTNH
jgi:hypothetical protein